MAKGLTNYLRHLRFEPSLLRTFHAKIITNFRLVFLLISLIVTLGTVSFLNIPRRLNPEVKIPIVTVVTVLPGANPKDVESLVTIPIENKIGGVKDLDSMTSSSRESVSTIVLQFKSTVEPEKAKTDVDSLMGRVTDLPEDAQTPFIAALDFEDQPVWNFALTSSGDYVSLMRFSKILKKNLENDPKVDRVIAAGINEERIEVRFDPLKLNEFNINPVLLSQTVTRLSNSYPAGSLETTDNTYSLTIDSQITSLDDLRNTRISLDGANPQTVRLGDIASVVEASRDNDKRSYFATKTVTPRPAVQFFVYKVSSANIDESEKAMKKVVTETVAPYQNRFEVHDIVNSADEISKQFSELLGEFGSTVVLVFINLLIFLGLRQAFISSLTVPLTFLASITILNALGYTLNFLTMFAFLLTLGLLIDDTIVTVTAITRYFATKRFTATQAGLLVWRDFIVPLWSTTITTVWAFVPLLLASGIIGQFIKPLPVVVTTTMLSSTSIAVFITLPLMMIVLEPHLPERVKTLLKIIGIMALLVIGFLFIPKTPIFPVVYLLCLLFFVVAYKVRQTISKKGNGYIEKNPSLKKIVSKISTIGQKGLIDTEALSVKYMHLIERIISSKSARRKTLLLIAVFAAIGYLLIPLGFVTNEFFPKVDQDTFYVTVDMPAGSTLDKSDAEARRWMAELIGTPELKHLTAEVGSQFDVNGGRSDGSGSFIITVSLLDKKKRKISSQEIAQSIRDKYKNYQGGTLLVQEQSGGPPAGADLQIKILGKDLARIDSYAEKIVGFLKKDGGVANVSKSIKTGTSKILFVPNREKMAEAGITLDSVGLWLRSTASGFTLDTLRLNDEDKDIVFTLGPQDKTPEDLGNIYIANNEGISYSLLSLGTVKLQTNPTVIDREDGKRTISVSAAVLPGSSTTSEKNKKLEDFAKSLSLPSGYSWKTGGVNEENQKSVQSIFNAMGISFLLILVTMVIEFGSFRQAFIALTTIPLAVAGVFYLFGLTGTPLSFPALIGVLSLFGIEVTTVIVIMEKINDNIKEGFNLKDSVVEAAGSRLEPILLTSITSILGLLPITLADPLWRGLGGAIIAGLLIGGFVKLFYVPIMYYVFFSRDEKFVKKESLRKRKDGV